MKLSRRNALHLVAGAASLAAMPRTAWAQAYPSRPVRLVVPFAAGGNADVFGRMIGQWLSEQLGQPFVVENRAGAGTNIGTEAVVRAPADGHTLLLVAPSAAINAALYGKLSFNFIRDVAPVAGLIRQHPIMLVNPSFPARTVGEFIDFAKANPGTISFASQGVGSPGQLAAELFKMLAGIDMVHVPYRGGGPALTDLIGGQVHVMFISAGASIEHMRSGRLRALAVASANRSKALPDLPTIGEFVPGYEMSSWFGIGAPQNTPEDIVEKLNETINAGLAHPKIKAMLADLDTLPFPGSPADFKAFVIHETEKWAKVVRAAKLTAG